MYFTTSTSSTSLIPTLVPIKKNVECYDYERIETENQTERRGKEKKVLKLAQRHLPNENSIIYDL